MKPPVSKFRAQRTVVDGITFASKREATRYGVLKLLARAGEISELILQPKYPIVINGTKVCTYIADFRYQERGQQVVEDVKGFKTPMYRLKKKLVQAQFGISIRES